MSNILTKFCFAIRLLAGKFCSTTWQFAYRPSSNCVSLGELGSFFRFGLFACAASITGLGFHGFDSRCCVIHSVAAASEILGSNEESGQDSDTLNKPSELENSAEAAHSSKQFGRGTERFSADDFSVEELQSFDRLMIDLSSSSFEAREKACIEIDKLDERYLPAIQDRLTKLKSPDARARLQGIIERREKERTLRITREFLVNSDQEAARQSLPGWETFSTASGFSDRRTKALFLKMLADYPWLVYEKIHSPEDAYEKAVLVATEIAPRLDVAGEVSEGDGVALSYTLAMVGDKLDLGLETTGHRVFSRHPFSTKLTAVSRSATTQSSNAIFNFYDRFATHAKNDYRLIFCCLNAQIPVGAKIGARYLASDKATDQPEVFEIAMLAIARFGTAEHIPVVEKWLTNKTLITQAQRISTTNTGFRPHENVDVQARDLALATTILLHRESPHVIFPAYQSHATQGFFPNSVGQIVGTSDEVRDELLRAWQERSKQIPQLHATPDKAQ